MYIFIFHFKCPEFTSRDNKDGNLYKFREKYNSMICKIKLTFLFMTSVQLSFLVRQDQRTTAQMEWVSPNARLYSFFISLFGGGGVDVHIWTTSLWCYHYSRYFNTSKGFWRSCSLVLFIFSSIAKMWISFINQCVRIYEFYIRFLLVIRSIVSLATWQIANCRKLYLFRQESYCYAHDFAILQRVAIRRNKTKPLWTGPFSEPIRVQTRHSFSEI